MDSLQLRLAMRKLWTDHVVWTRDVVISSLADLPDQPVALERLMRNQDELGAALGMFYGAAAGRQAAALLREHITGAAAVIAAARAQDQSALATAQAAWRANADQIARTLASLNPYLAEATLRGMLHTHLDQLTDEVTARLAGDWPRDVRAFDQTVDHILALADALAAAIAQQFRLPGSGSGRARFGLALAAGAGLATLGGYAAWRATK